MDSNRPEWDEARKAVGNAVDRLREAEKAVEAAAAALDLAFNASFANTEIVNAENLSREARHMTLARSDLGEIRRTVEYVQSRMWPGTEEK